MPKAKASINLKIGSQTITVEQEISSPQDLVKFASAYSIFPSEGPNGEDDLRLCHRTPQDFDYYSVVSDKSGIELELSETKKHKILYPKSWVKVHPNRAKEERREEDSPPPISQPTTSVRPSTAAAPAVASATKNSDIAVQSAASTYPTANDLPDTDPLQVQKRQYWRHLTALGFKDEILKGICSSLFKGITGVEIAEASVGDLKDANTVLDQALTHGFYVEWSFAAWNGSLARKGECLGLIAIVLYKEGVDRLKAITGEGPDKLSSIAQNRMIGDLRLSLA